MTIKGKLVAGVALTAMMTGGGGTHAYAQGLVTSAAAVGAVQGQGKANKPKKSKRPKKGDQQTTPGASPSDDAQKVDNAPKVDNQSGRLEGDIIVTGLINNVKSARGVKRRAQQIVDVVLAQDIGKLPDKNVAEALARVPGIQIDRDRGEGGTVLIRGLSGVMTTVNGSPTFTGLERTTNLSDISSDLVAGIEVYKTRTPDQVEGSQTGVVNLTLRRPTDFKEGATYALSTRYDYSDRVKKLNPYYSALVAYNGDSSIGRLGFSVNGTWNKVTYNEDARFNELPSLLTSIRQPVLPTSTPARIYLPFRVGFSGTDGWSKRAAFQVSTQWKPDDHWAVTLEGGYGNGQAMHTDSTFWIPINYSESLNAPPSLSNVVLADDGRLVKSVSLYGLDPMGPGRQSYRKTTNDYNARFQLQYNSERVEFNGWFNYRKYREQSDSLYHSVRFSKTPRVDVVFNDENDPKGGVRVDFKDIDVLDPNNYVYIDNFGQQVFDGISADKEVTANLRLNTFWEVIDYFKVGYRYNNRNYSNSWASNWYASLRLPISELPDYKLSAVGYNFQSGSNANWMIGNSDSIRASFPKIRSMLTSIYPELVNPYPKQDPNERFTGGESGHAVYGQFHYNVKLLVPVEGIIGARIVNSITSLTARLHVEQFVTNEDGLKVLVKTDTYSTPKGNGLDVLPSLNAIFHFTPKLQLRTSYTLDVQRPRANDINPRLEINLQDPGNPSAYGGNAQLRPYTTTKYDASLEWYFGSTGSASVAVWQWNQDNLIARQTLPEYLPESMNVPARVSRPRNLGRGRHRGIEGQVTTFFTFLPGILQSFGTSLNGTINITRQAYPEQNEKGETVFIYGPIRNVSKFVYNLVGFFEKDGLNVRVAYNWQSRRQWWLDGQNPYNNLFRDPVERLDAAINYDVNKHLTVGLEASNLTRSGDNSYWGTYDAPNAIKYFSRNFAFSLRSRF